MRKEVECERLLMAVDAHLANVRRALDLGLGKMNRVESTDRLFCPNNLAASSRIDIANHMNQMPRGGAILMHYATQRRQRTGSDSTKTQFDGIGRRFLGGRSPD